MDPDFPVLQFFYRSSKQCLLAVVFLFLSDVSCAQGGQWTWMSGDSTLNAVGHRGALGVFTPLNCPGSRYESLNFTDQDRNFWLFGGLCDDSVGIAHDYSDLWKYDVSTNEWAWVKGPSLWDQPGTVGTLGVLAAANNPPSCMAVCSWSDVFNNLWMLSLDGKMWRFDIDSGMWACMKSGPAHYGSQGMPDILNNPPARDEVTCTWSLGENLWMFGGRSGSSYRNDLWKFEVSSNTWTWMSGNSTVNATGIYGVKGVPSGSTKPGARSAYCSWSAGGKMWLFGGNNSLLFNDLWSYDITSGYWTWESGDSLASLAQGRYGQQCTAAALNVPGHRTENKSCWIDDLDNLWMYSGGQAPPDMWKFDVNIRQWTWVMGDTALPVGGTKLPTYGTKGVPSILNSPGSRNGTPSWTAADGSMWLFGGIFVSGDKRNDMWRFTLDTAQGSCNYVGIRTLDPFVNCMLYNNFTSSSCLLEINVGQPGKCSLSLFDLQGRQVWTLSGLEKYNDIDMQSFAPGIYFLQLTDGERLKLFKVVRN